MAKREHYCSFCGKSSEEVERILAGPCVMVCNECVDMLHKLMHEPKPILPVKPAKAVKERTVIPFRQSR